MAPPTVFSYLRRDHRRSSSPAASPTANSSASPVNVSLQAPATYSPYSGGSIESLPFSESQSRYPPSPHTENNRRSSFVPLELPSTIHESFESYWAPDNDAKPAQEAVTSREPQELLRPDASQGDGPNKPTSPWRVSLGKINISDNLKGGTRGGLASGGAGRGRRSFENESPGQDVGFMKDSGAAPAVRREGIQDGNTEMGPSRHGKTRLNLLNPMALLARRRSGQVLPRPEDVNIGKMGLPALPDDYDPRIRGKLFHDFSAPRPKPNVPGYNTHHNRTKDFDRRHDVQAPAKASQNEPDRSEETEQVYEKHNEHAPLFREHFEDDKKALQVESKGYVESLATSDTTPSSSLPAFTKQLPVELPSMNEQQEPPEHIGSDADFVAAKPKSRTSTVRDKPPPMSAVPKRFTSNASRFSFDLAGVDSSAQEKIMEDKHKQREAARRANAPADNSNDFDSDEFDYDAMMDDDGLEERIPGVNADADDYGDLDDSMGLNANHLAGNRTMFVPVLPTVMSDPMSPLNLDSPAQPQVHGVRPENQADAPNAASTSNMNGSSLQLAAPSQDDAKAQQQTSKLTSVLDDDDDLYFDDGLIDDVLPDTGDDKFDESIFDDPNSHLYERKKRSSMPLNTVLEDQEEHNAIEEDDEVPSGIRGTHGTIVREHANRITSKGTKDDTLEEQSMHDFKPQQPIHGLTQGNLEAYHSALAQAANEAALNGRFRRSMSESDESADQGCISPTPDSHPGLTADDSRISQNIDSAGFEDDMLDDFDYDDAGMDDDLIIAAANAEALENDDEGFYGQEFGFYAHDHGNCDSEMVLGGYFGPRRVEGVTRSHSGRINFQEPSLTPITERSEWSTRNSIISLSTHAAHSNPAVSSPALAQLVDMGNLEDEMTLSSLMRLRRGAWGGSNGSLRSSAASQGGTSPQSHQPSSNLGSFTSFQDVIGDQSRSSSALANAPTGSEDIPPQSENPTPAPEPEVEVKSPPVARKSEDRRHPPPLSIDTVKANISRPGKDDASHSRTSSVAESISYVKETDESGINCWVLEKRRTGESGESDVFEREPLTSGRI